MSSVVEFFTALSRYDFLQSALITAIMVGIMSGIIGSFIILRGMSLMGDAISHAVLPGVAVAYMLGINVLIGASVFGILAAMLIGFVAAHSKIKTDTSIGVVFSAFYALGFILISMAESSTNLHHILFGNILAVSDSDIMTTAVVLGIVLLFVVAFYKELLITSFDATYAQTYGLNVQVLHYGLMLVLTLVTVSALQTVGIILVVAMLITPAATAYLWTDKLSTMLVLSALVGVVSSITGLYFSYTLNWASGPAIVLVAAGLFVVSFIFSPKQAFIKFRAPAKAKKNARQLPVISAQQKAKEAH
ncbi:MAG: metal ABC transporter permease [Schleiferilactobacillus perolens]|uniref:metal ABC transporter permease n=1 Tax=Schleiferilactobacillus perolens TaxID=100468 RepID=UPI0039EB6345